MKFKSYLGEQEVDKMEFINAVKKDCRPYLQLLNRVGDGALTRTVTYSVSFYKKRKVRKGRKPKDTPELLHNLIDEYLYKQFGGKPRSNGLFCWADSRSPGHMKFIFPIGRFRYVWSPEVTDLYVDLKRVWDKAMGYPKYEMTEASDEDYYEFFDYLKKTILPTYTNNNLFQTLMDRQSKEVMIDCDEYYIVNGYKFLAIRSSLEGIKMMRKI